MRIYTTERREYKGENSTCVLPASGYYNVPDAVGAAWIAEGLAFKATLDNKVEAYREGDVVVEIVAAQPGDRLGKYHSTPQPPEVIDEIKADEAKGADINADPELPPEPKKSKAAKKKTSKRGS